MFGGGGDIPPYSRPASSARARRGIPGKEPRARGPAHYVKNKAGLTGQTVPGRRIPGHWPYPGPEELAETEPCVPGLIDVPFFVSFNTPPERVLAKLGRQAARLNLEAFRTKRHCHTIFIMSLLPSVCQLS